MATGSVGTDVCGLTTPPSTYDQIGVGYTVGRRSDPGRSRAIENALDRAGSVINVGAGTGSYEPTNRRVVAVEPSEVMLGPRADGAAPAIRAMAKHLPFPDSAPDAGLAVLTVHHWADWRSGLDELRRVAPLRVVLTYDPAG